MVAPCIDNKRRGYPDERYSYEEPRGTTPHAHQDHRCQGEYWAEDIPAQIREQDLSQVQGGKGIDSIACAIA